jgi:biopolymer transport protein ExbD
MGAVDQPQRQSKSKGKGLRRPKRRVGIRIDMTPMVDIAFLLLIFYMVTTIFSAPQSMEIVLPPKESKDVKIDVGKTNLLELLVDADGNIFWQNDRADKPMPLPEYLPKQNLRKFLLEKNQQNDKLVTIIRLEKSSKFENMVNIFDEIQVVERLFKQTNPSWSYKRSLLDMTEWEFQLLEQAKAAMGGIPKPAAGGTTS